jgi:hypothetical protein
MHLFDVVVALDVKKLKKMNIFVFFNFVHVFQYFPECCDKLFYYKIGHLH